MGKLETKIKHFHPLVRWLILADYACLVVLLSLAPPQVFHGQSVLQLPFSDKIAHFLIYTGFALLMFWALHRQNRAFLKGAVVTVGCGVVFGIIMELLQPIVMPGERFFSIADITANTAGTLTGIAFFWVLAKSVPVMYYKIKIFSVFLLLFTLAGSSIADEDTGMTLVEKGESRAVIVLPADAPSQVKKAAEELQRCIKLASDADLEITDTADSEKMLVHVGRTPYVDSLALPTDQLYEDGFVVKQPEPGHLVIVGATEWGTSFGVYRFLEEFLDVRWLLPGDIGRSLPTRETITIPDTVLRENPAFLSRRLSGFRNSEQRDWARRNGMRNSIKYHHNLRNLYDPKVFAEEHPEFYPIINNYRFNPLESDKRWQPCLTASGIVEAGAERIRQHFRESPEAESYSLGINDTLRFCECQECRNLDSDRTNNAGYRHLSDRYFTWANAVVEKVLEDFPDKQFGTLAYLNIAEAPDNVSVNSRIVPFLTSDRMRWAISDFAETEKKITREWQNKVRPLGWYDYIYGTPYCVPRLYPHLQAEYLRWAHEHDVRYLAAEAYPNFAEGPKLYAWLKLAWDPDQDINKLLDEWYERCVGKQAAPVLKTYYEYWENFWTERVLETQWFDRQGHFLSFYTPGYLKAVTREDLEKSRSWLNEAVEKAGTQRQRRRAKLMKKGFEYYEATVIAYQDDWSESAPADEEDVLASLPKRFKAAEMARKRLKLVQEFADHPVLRHSNPPSNYEALEGEDWHDRQLLPLFPWLRENGEIRRRFKRAGESSEYEKVQETAEQTLQIADAWDTASIVPNASFEQGDDWATGWTLWIREGVGKMSRTSGTSHSGDAAIKAQGIEHGSINQRVVLDPGTYAVTAFVYTPEQRQRGGTVKIAMIPADENGGNILEGMVLTELKPAPGNWQPMAVKGEVPAVIEGREVASIGVFAMFSDFTNDAEVFIDDLHILPLR
ncbi:MAG: VanZ family protein [Lentisphaeria bacterium]